jgi:hypothetical protein
MSPPKKIKKNEESKGRGTENGIHFEYVVGMVGEHTFTVAKFGLRGWPLTIYTVGWYGGDHLTCSCPGGMHLQCKHRKMVWQYLNHGMPVMNCFWLDNKGVVNGVFAHVSAELKEQIEGITEVHGALVKKRRRK